jgi:hypothetical protein
MLVTGTETGKTCISSMIRPPESFDGLDDFAVIFSEKEK